MDQWMDRVVQRPTQIQQKAAHSTLSLERWTWTKFMYFQQWDNYRVHSPFTPGTHNICSVVLNYFCHLFFGVVLKSVCIECTVDAHCCCEALAEYRCTNEFELFSHTLCQYAGLLCSRNPSPLVTACTCIALSSSMQEGILHCSLVAETGG